jgi:hypothetical protein
MDGKLFGGDILAGTEIESCIEYSSFDGFPLILDGGYLCGLTLFRAQVELLIPRNTCAVLKVV